MHNALDFARIQTVGTCRAPYYPDGWTVEARDKEGRHYVLMDVCVSKDKADRLAAQVQKRGEIMLDLWACHVPYGTDAWLLDNMEITLMDDEEQIAKGIL